MTERDPQKRVSKGRSDAPELGSEPPGAEEVTERLRESEERFRLLAEQTPDAVLMVDAEGTVLFTNPAAESFFGLERARLEGSQFGFPVVGGETTELEIPRAGGEVAWAEMRVVEASLEQQPVYVASLRDITERRRAQDALTESERRFRTIFNSVAEGIYIHELNGCFLEANDVILHRLGYSIEELREMRPEDIDAPEYAPHVADRVRVLKRDGEHDFEVEHVTREGQRIPTDVISRLVLYEGRQVVLSTARDVSDRYEIRRQLTLLSSAIEQASESVHVTDMNGSILFVNPAFETLTGYSSSEAQGMWAGRLRAPEFPKEEYRAMWEEIRRGRSWSGALRGLRKDGGCFDVAASLAPVWAESGEIEHSVMVMRDVSQEMALELQLRQAQKMEAIGTLAGGIAHDFNNILSAILGYSELTLRNLPRESEERENLQEVVLAGRRARDLIRQILAFSRRSEEAFQPIEFHLILKEAFKLLRSSLPTSIEMRQNIRKCRPLLGDPTQLHQVVMNLCTNAGQAMGEGVGTLSVELEEKNLSEEEAAEQGLGAAGTYLRLTVSDTGHGISPTVKERIFEPYFTTKQHEKGTGLGLSVVHGIVKAHGGSISVESQPGKGSTFLVFFPATELETEAAGAEATEAPLLGGNECILVVDDERALAHMIRQMLEDFGYRLEVFTDSREALERFRADPGHFDLVITDQAMPGLTGDRLIQKMLSLRPSLPVILCTGYSERIDEQQAKSLGALAFMVKPLTRQELGRTVRHVLDEKKPDR
jgi:PAS domain S-box-containing protein